jgi:hypothetical protein
VDSQEEIRETTAQGATKLNADTVTVRGHEIYPQQRDDVLSVGNTKAVRGQWSGRNGTGDAELTELPLDVALP